MEGPTAGQERDCSVEQGIYMRGLLWNGYKRHASDTDEGQTQGGGAIGGSEPSTFEREGRRGTVMQDGQGEGFVMRRRRP